MAAAERLAAARGGDEAAFAALVEPHRGELRVHCYRMLGSIEDAEDLVQETFLRAWRHLGGFEGRSSLRAWLYRIATNACLDALDGRARRVVPQDLRPPSDPGVDLPPRMDIPWLQPCPDRLLEPAAPAEDEPQVAVVGRETIRFVLHGPHEVPVGVKRRVFWAPYRTHLDHGALQVLHPWPFVVAQAAKGIAALLFGLFHVVRRNADRLLQDAGGEGPVP
mgnify:CR=1 FL=1